MQPRASHGFVHAIEGAEQGGFTAARRSDQRSHLMGGDSHIDVEESLFRTIEKIDSVYTHPHARRRCRLARRVYGGWIYVYRHGLPHGCMH